MSRFTVYVYEADGSPVVAEALEALARSSAMTFASIQSGIEMLEAFGADTGLNKFKRLRHTASAYDLYELRAQTRPAYRVLFAAVPGEDAYVLLDVVPKTDMERNSDRSIQRAVRRLEEWLGGESR